MEANNNQSNASDNSEHGTGTKAPEKKRKRNDQVENDEDIQQLESTEHNFNIAEQMRIMQEKLTALNGEVETVKSENRVLSEKNNKLVARVSDMQDKQEILEKKLEVAEMETKLAKKIADKANEANNQLRDELLKMASGQMVEEKVNKMATQMEEKQRKFMEEVQQKFGEQEAKMAEKDKKLEQLEKLAKQIDQGMTEFGEKMATLESQATEGRNKLEEMRKTLEISNQPKVEWSNNKWHISEQKGVQTSADRLTVTKANDSLTNVHAQHPFSREMLDIIPGQKLVYWEVAIKNGYTSYIGWVGPNVPLNDKCIGELPGSFSISFLGNYWESGPKIEGYGTGFGEGDVVGSGLLLTRNGRLKLFFTLNGALNGKPIVLEGIHDLLLYPAIRFYRKDTSAEANFGADSAGKPFMFDVNAHETELFG